MSDMSRCQHGDAIGYCDICSPNWEDDLFRANVQDTIYAAGIKRGGGKELESLQSTIELCKKHGAEVYRPDDMGDDITFQYDQLAGLLDELRARVRRETLEEAADRFFIHSANAPLCDGTQIAIMLKAMANETG